VAAKLEAELEKQGLTDQVEIRKTGCHGYCERGPMTVIHPEEISYFQIQPEDAPEIISETIQEKKVIDRLLYKTRNKEEIVKESEIPFYKFQERLVFGSNGSIDPKSIDDYLAIGGYAALKKALYDMTPKGFWRKSRKPI
jgi:(2Fe-2S) ferredoxin